jgi:chorismate dehydratase
VAKTKISVVQYLNSVPLAWSILEGSLRDGYEAVLSTPAECADQLAQGSVDVGLIPSIEFHRIKGCRIVAGPVVASRHRVKSVLLISEVPLWRVRTVVHDKGSRTSVALAQIIFKEFYKTRPSFRAAEPDLANMLATSDAALIIGDAALRFMQQQEIPSIDGQKSLVRHGAEPLHVFDLMERWQFLTGLPFVFAFWAVRSGFTNNGLAETLKTARDEGVANIPSIAARYAETLGMKKEFVQDYLEDNVYYYMDKSCSEGLQLFYEKAADVGAIKSVRPLEFL